ncbi:NYN domain-containing protein [Helicobacter brantae]|uniref:NYN domain-containing protein n=1 Tax=Helicobacter brantae TaxID=375927 RepID=UPI001FE30774|nr:NYN domain-containing protein [Helicobacter brantae]
MFCLQKNKKVAVIVDGSFFRKRYFDYYKKNYSNTSPEVFAKAIHTHSLKHIQKNKGEELYRIYYYDCHPFSTKAHYPNSKGMRIYKSEETETFKFQTELYKKLIDLPCFALRYGYLNPKNAHWDIVEKKKIDVLKGKIRIEDLQDQDFVFTAKQKGVDIKIGIDIASLSIKRLVEKIVLITGDSDFIPAIKLARTEGVQVVLDPMGNPITLEMRENIDFLTTKLLNFKK